MKNQKSHSENRENENEKKHWWSENTFWVYIIMSEAVKAADNRSEQDVIFKQINTRSEQITADYTKLQWDDIISQ